MAFLVPRSNAELVPKFHFALHASHAALPMATSKFRPSVALQMLSFTLSPTFLYQKEERALPGNIQTGTISASP
jgi:hypothetical protein